jgi:hypothetical protein
VAYLKILSRRWPGETDCNYEISVWPVTRQRFEPATLFCCDLLALRCNILSVLLIDSANKMVFILWEIHEYASQCRRGPCCKNATLCVCARVRPSKPKYRSHVWTSALTVSWDGNRRPLRCFFFSLLNTWKSKGAESWLYDGWDGAQTWLREQDISFYHQGLQSLIVCYDKCLKSLEAVWKNKGPVFKDTRIFLSPLTPIHLKERGPYFLTSLRMYGRGFYELCYPM